MANLLAFDQGTTSSRALVFDERGTVLGRSQREFEQIFPQPGWVEHDPNVIWETQLAVAREVLQEGACDPASIAAIGITNQRETTVVWDRTTGEPLYNAIVWQDRRTAEFCDWLKSEGHGDLFRERTGLLVDAYFSGTKLRWILDHVDGARERAAAGDLAFGTVDSWLIYKLTAGAVHATDSSNASRTLLYNIHRGEWDDDLLALLDVPRAMLPEVRPSSGDFGTLADGLLPVRLPIRGVAGDQQAALFGQRCVEPGMAKNTYGTGCFMLMHTGDKAVTSANNLLTTIAWEIDGQTSYALEGSIFVGGAVVQWLRDGLGIIAGADDVEPLARSVRDSGGVVLVPAFVGLGAPHWDAYARGTIVGLTLGSTAAHIARAALESIAFQTADVMRAMEADAGLTLPELRVDGGAVTNDLLMQFQADILNVPVARPHSTEITALGAACLAGLAAGVWDGTDAIVASWQPDCRFVPTMDASQREKLINRWHRALERARGWST